MKKRLAYLFLTLAAVTVSAVACTGYGAQLDDLQQQINDIHQWTVGGDNFKSLGDINKRLIVSIEEDESQVFVTLSDGTVVTIPKYDTLKLTLNGDEAAIGAGESITVTYKLEGAENAGVQVLCGTGWNAAVTTESTTSGSIEITAPKPLFNDKVVVFASDGKGRIAAAVMRLTIEETTFRIPTAAAGYQFYQTTGDAYSSSSSDWFKYRYGPSIIRHEDGSIDVWTAKEGSRYLNYSDYLYQENGTRSKVPAEGKVIAQYFNSQHRFMRVLVALYGTGQSSDKIDLKLYKWAGSYAATLGTQPIGTYDISAALPESGNRYSIYKPDKSWIPAGKYMWTATGASEGVGVFKYSGAGTISVIDSRSYINGVLADDYNFQGKLRGSTNNNSSFVDRFAYWHSSDGGATWSEERDVMFPTEGSEDHYSVCDPGAAYFGGWYYIAYTSAPSQYGGKYNHCYVARSRTPMGPWYKWNGSDWGGEPAKIITFTGATNQWGAGEPCIVVKDDVIYFYYTWTESTDAEDGPTTRLATAPISEDWPAHLDIYGTVIDKSQFMNADHCDVKYVEDYGLFYAFHTYNRYRSNSQIAVWTSPDGKNFTYQGDMTGNLVRYAGNMGVSGDGMGHIRLSEPQFIGYSYGGNSVGVWSTWFNPVSFE